MRTATLMKVLRANPPKTLQGVKMLCAKYGEPLSARVQASAAASSGCAPVGCDQVYLDNEGGGWGLMEAYIEPTSGLGPIQYGEAYFNRHTNSTGGNASWSENLNGDAGGNWFYTQYLYPLAPTGTSSWVSVGFNAVVATSKAYIGWASYVYTWNYIT